MTKKKPDFLRDLDTAIMDELTGGGIKGNAAGLVGTLTQIKEIKQLCGLPFCGYMAKLETVRPSGVPDEVTVVFAEDVPYRACNGIEFDAMQEFVEGSRLLLTGKVQTLKDFQSGRLLVYILADFVAVSEKAVEQDEAAVRGVIANKPTYRETPRGKRITDITVKVRNELTGGSCFLPCICWQEQADEAAQWTYWSRKQALLNHAKQAGVSIADLNMQLGFLWEELQGYTAVMDALEKAGSVRAASDAVLTGYEKPADQSETVKKKRAEYGEGYYKKYAAGNGTKYYRVRKSWTDAASQLGAFTSLENAKSACKAGYTVYDDNGKAVYTAAGQQASAGVPFSVQVDILDLNIRTGAGTNYAKTGETTGKGVFTIVEVKAGQGASVGWGRLKSGAGWISLDYATRLA